MRLEVELVEAVEEATGVEYKKYFISDANKVLVVNEEVSSMMECLLDKIEGLEKEIEYLKLDRNENYKRIAPEDQYEQEMLMGYVVCLLIAFILGTIIMSLIIAGDDDK